MGFGWVTSLAGAALGGALLMAADPAPKPVTPEDQAAAGTAAIRKTLPTPHLFKVVAGGDVKTMDGMQLCMGAEQMEKMMAGLAKSPEAVKALSKGCTQTREKGEDGSMHLEMTCRRADGASQDIRFTMSGTFAHFRQHTEMAIPGLPKAMTMDMDVTEAGECPAGVSPGQVLKADGTVYDPQAELAKLTAQMQAEKAARDAEKAAKPH